jgi:hypothetical protein
MIAAVLSLASENPYHPDKHSSAPLDVLLCTIGLVILVLLVVIPAHLARAKEDRMLAAEQPPADQTTA